MTTRHAALLLFATIAAGCATPDGPRHALPSQDVTAPLPENAVRIVFFNTSSHLLYFESGPIRIQLDGQQVPSIWLDHYVQVFSQPGEHHLLLEHYDMFMWTSEYDVDFDQREVFLEVYNNPTSTRYKQVDDLPADFHDRFTPRDAENW